MELSVGTVGRKADNSDMLDHAVRVGLVVYGVVHLVIAWTALQLVFGSGGGSTSQSGALAKLARNPLGQALMWVCAFGFLALLVWQAAEAAVGHRGDDGAKRAFKRVGSAVKVVVYALLGWKAASLAVGSGGGGGGGGTNTMTAKLMSMPGGVVLVAVVGLVIVGVGCYLGYRGWEEKFTKRLDARATSGERRTPIVMLGKAGYLAKGASLGIVGGLFLWAAVTHDPKHSGGLDQALHKLLQGPAGGPLLFVIAVGIACYGFFCFAWARHLDR